jgi:glycosyltransferase involved in cell wall biosynthesis
MKEYAGRILMLLENAFPRDPRVRNEAFTLARAGYKITIIALRKEKNEKRKEKINGVTVYRAPLIDLFKKTTSADIWVRIQLQRVKSALGYVFEYFYFTSVCFFLSLYIAVKDGFDVIQAHNPPNTLFLVGLFYRMFGKKFVFDHHDLAPELYLSRYDIEDGFIYRMLLLEEKLCLRAANMVIATNGSYKEIDVKRAKIRSEKVFIVRNGPDLGRVRLVAPDTSLKRTGKKILVYVGKMGPQDGVDYLLRALRYMVHKLKRTDFFCIIIGPGDVVEDLKILAHELRVEDYVWFTGYIPEADLLRYLSTADICLDPNPSNPLNDSSTWIKVMEYMALGKPIVSFDLKETRFSAQGAALYVPPNDELEYAKTIIKLMDNPSKRAQMGVIGRKRVLDELSWQHVSKNLLLAYDWIFKDFQDKATFKSDSKNRNIIEPSGIKIVSNRHKKLKGQFI